jgi:hypothetical protein
MADAWLLSAPSIPTHLWSQDSPLLIPHGESHFVFFTSLAIYNMPTSWHPPSWNLSIFRQSLRKNANLDNDIPDSEA